MLAGFRHKKSVNHFSLQSSPPVISSLYIISIIPPNDHIHSSHGSIEILKAVQR